MKHYRNLAITIICVILGITIAWQGKSIYYNQNSSSAENKRLEELKDDLIREKKNTEDLRKRNAELEKENIDFENARGKNDETAAIITKQLDRARMIAGLTDVKGQGVVITLENNDIYYVDDTNILDVLNELRASDAQAISVNDERIIATSEVRVAGKYIMINGKQFLSPFVIKAIADPEKIERSLKIIDGVVEKLEAYQLKVTVEKLNSVVIPRVKDDGSVIKTDLLSPVK